MMGYDESVFKTDFQFNGPQGQPVYSKRIPITFKNNQNASRTVYFSNYFDWMGQVREYSLLPISKNLKNILETGLWGMATNFVKFSFFKQLVADDVLEIRLWLNRVSGEKKAVFDLKFEWLRVLPNNKFEEIALSEQRISWIKITGHGEGYVDYLPESIQKFMDLMKPKEEIETQQSKLFLNFSLNKEIKNYSRKGPLLSEQIFITALEESNLVGNIYFSNYGKWLGKTRDLYFFQFMPQYYLGIQNTKEFFCTNCEIQYLNEAMPFDKIKVKMFLNKVYETGLELYFEFFKENEDVMSKRLAFATHTIVWGAISEGVFMPEKLPKVLQSQFNLG
jgi:acyl-CoA thioesterase FadM